jgi:hypothetical protein
MILTFSKLCTFKKRDLESIIRTKNKDTILSFLNEWGLCVKHNKILPTDQYRKIWLDFYSYYDKKQLVKKINLR